MEEIRKTPHIPEDEELTGGKLPHDNDDSVEKEEASLPDGAEINEDQKNSELPQDETSTFKDDTELVENDEVPVSKEVPTQETSKDSTAPDEYGISDKPDTSEDTSEDKAAKDCSEESSEFSSEKTTDKADEAHETDETKDDKKKKKLWLIIAVIVGVLVFIGLTFAKSLGSNKPQESETIDYMQYVTGLPEELTFEVIDKEDKNDGNIEKIDFMDGITWDEQYIQQVSCDNSQVDLTKAGEYEITYLIDVLGEDEEDIEKIVKVIVAEVGTTTTEENKKDAEAEKTETTSGSNPSVSTGSQTSTGKPSNNSGSTSSTGSSGSGSGTTTKPSSVTSSNGSSSSSGSSTPSSKPSSNSGNGSSTTHTHNWVAVTETVTHPEEGHYDSVCVQDAWDEPVYETVPYMTCNTCGYEMYSASEYENHGDATGHWGFTDRYKSTLVNTIHHDAVYEQKYVVDKAAWTETVTTGYKCSCGATK